MQSYVVSFLFDQRCERVLLMMKRRPAWQAGKRNGVGGKVEPGESVHDAMHREGLEEIGVQPIWLHYVSLEYPEAHIAFSPRVARQSSTPPSSAPTSAFTAIASLA